MASLIARRAQTVLAFRCYAVAGVRRSLGGTLSPSELQTRSNSVEGLDCWVLPNSDPTSADAQVGSPLSRQSPQAFPKTQAFGAESPVNDRSEDPSRKKGLVFRVRGANLNPHLNPTGLKRNHQRASSNVADQSYLDSPPKQSFIGSTELALLDGTIPTPSASPASQAIAMLKHRQQQGLITIDSYMFIEVLKRCSDHQDLAAAREVHDCIIQNGMAKHPQVANSLLHVYIKCGRPEHALAVFEGLEKKTIATWNMMIGAYTTRGNISDARRIFDQMEMRDLITWNRLIGSYAKHGRGREAYSLFLRMIQEGFTPNAITYISILNPSSSLGALEWVRDVHSHAKAAGLDSDLRVGSALIHMYAKSSITEEARLVFEGMEKRDVITWSMMIGAYAASGFGAEAYQLFLRMKREGFIPNAFTYASILNSPPSLRGLEWVKDVHSHALTAGLESDLRVGSALVHMYAKYGQISDARMVFNRMEKRDGITWSMMIGAYAASGGGAEAYQLFLQMKREGFTPDAVTYVNILNGSASVGALEWVREMHGHISAAGLEGDLQVGNALIHMYSKSGSIDDAGLIFNRMVKRDVVTWTALLGGLAHHGCGQEALELFRRMIASSVLPNGTTFVAVLSACCHAGLVEDGRRIFQAMAKDYGIEPTVVHCTCMVDLLGRAGQLEEARLFIKGMGVEPNGVTWQALLGACRTHGNVELGEVAARELLRLEPKKASGYVLLSNIYAAAGECEKVSKVRKMMQKRGVWKEPGRSWIEVDGKIHEFVAGDRAHPEAEEIHSELKRLTERLKGEGYVPDTQIVLTKEVGEEDKELALCSHSEKLAIVYGLMRTPCGEPVRVYKNLRVCSDCHTASKFISVVTGREIIARDAIRFHHFKDGVCSCGDYW